MPNIIRPNVEIISVDEFQTLIATARDAKIQAGIAETAPTEILAPDITRGMPVPVFRDEEQSELKILHPEEAATLVGLQRLEQEQEPYVNTKGE